jgi:ribonuclease HI
MKKLWIIQIDGSTNKRSSRASIVLRTLVGQEFKDTIKFGFKTTNNEAEYGFKTTNNEAEYKAVIARLEEYEAEYGFKTTNMF